MLKPFAKPVDAYRYLAKPALKLVSDYGWSCPIWARLAATEVAEIDRLLQGCPRDIEACRRLIEATGLYLAEQAGVDGARHELLVGWRMPEHPLTPQPLTIECHACKKIYRLCRRGGRIRCTACEAERWIGEPYLEQLLPNVVAAFAEKATA